MTRVWALAASLILLVAVGCKSEWIDATIENQTGKPLHEIQVDYPTASFGANALDPGAVMHYRFQTRGRGTIKVGYTEIDGKTDRAEGPRLEEHQQGQLTIRLLPMGKVDFLANLRPPS